MMYDGYRTMAYDGASAEARAAASDEKRLYIKALINLDDVMKAEPQQTATIMPCADQLDQLHALLESPSRRAS